MSLSMKGFSDQDAELNSQEKITTLNPNAAEFVPSSLRSVSGGTKKLDVTGLDVPGTSGKAVLDRSELTISHSSDDEVHQFWCRQLPDDITPDFKVMGEDKLQGPSSISLAGLSIHDGTETTRFPASVGNQLLGKQQEMWTHGSDSTNLSEKLRYSGLTHAEDQSSPAFMNMARNHLEKQLLNGNHHLTNGNEGDLCDGDSSAAGFLYDLLDENSSLETTTFNPVDFLASQFPGFSAESLANAYYANGSDLKLTIKFLKQLEIQVDCGLNQNLNSKSFSASTVSALHFPSLPGPGAQNGMSKYTGDGLQHVSNSYRCVDKESFPFLKSTHGTSRNTPDFASAVRKHASLDSGHWKPERNGSADGSFGQSRTSQRLGSSFNGHGKSVYADKLCSPGAVWAASVWLETGDAVANSFSESREEARDLARVRNAFFEQARQAYLIGNNALAKELSAKGQLYNMQMKAAHEKAREFISRHRNPVAPELQSYGHGQDPLIDLHGLHVSEALHVLKHELIILRRTARSAGQRLQVTICVGTGHHTRGSCAPARLPLAVEQYLLEEGLQYNEPQPGLLRVLIY